MIRADTEPLRRGVSNLELINIGQIFDGKLNTVIPVGGYPLVRTPVLIVALMILFIHGDTLFFR